MKRIIINLLLILTTSVLFGQTNNISLHQYCAAGYNQTWTININEAKAVKVEYQIDIFPGTDNIVFFDINSSGSTSYSGVTPTGFSSGTYITSTQTGKIQIVLYCNTAGMKNIEIKCTADNSIVTNSNLNVGGNGIITGKLGVGVTSPTKKMEIWDGITGRFTFSAASCTSGYEVAQTIDNTGYKLNVGSAIRDYRISINGGDKLTITSAGYMGIGTTNPTQPLDVEKDANYQLRLGNNGGFGYNIGRSVSTGYLNFYGDQSSYNGYVFGGVNGTFMTIKNNGYVGIGTATPNYKLEVAGGVKTYGDIYGSTVLTFQDDSRFSVTQTEIPSLNTTAFSMPQYGIAAPGVGGSADLWIAGNSGIRMFTGGNAVPKITITNTGNMGIGTNPDALYKLDVKGAVRATEIKVESIDNFPDFVFEKNYELLKLSEVNNFIQKNGHLPNIPSAAEVKQNGVSLVDMQAKLLQKVEELTLYSIQQQELIQSLQTQIDELKNSK
jgi:hypothetical protein